MLNNFRPERIRTLRGNAQTNLLQFKGGNQSTEWTLQPINGKIYIVEFEIQFLLCIVTIACSVNTGSKYTAQI